MIPSWQSNRHSLPLAANNPSNEKPKKPDQQKLPLDAALVLPSIVVDNSFSRRYQTKRHGQCHCLPSSEEYYVDLEARILCRSFVHNHSSNLGIERLHDEETVGSVLRHQGLSVGSVVVLFSDHWWRQAKACGAFASRYSSCEAGGRRKPERARDVNAWVCVAIWIWIEMAKVVGVEAVLSLPNAALHVVVRVPFGVVSLHQGFRVLLVVAVVGLVWCPQVGSFSVRTIDLSGIVRVANLANRRAVMIGHWKCDCCCPRRIHDSGRCVFAVALPV